MRSFLHRATIRLSPTVGQKAWMLDRTARDAIALALTDSLLDRVVGAKYVERLATRVMRSDAVDF
jgi:hypothetical protein